MRGIGLTDAMDRMMRGFAGGADAASQGIHGAVGMLAQQKQLQDKMAFETSQAQAKMEAEQAAAQEKRAWDEKMARRKEDFDAADKGLRRRIVTEPNQQEFEHASSDVSARIKDNPVTNLFDSGLTGLIPAGVMTALEGGSVMNDPNNRARLMQQREDGWERDPTWVDPKAKPAAPPPTGLDPKRVQWFSGEARQRALKSPRLDQTTRFLLALDDPMTPKAEKNSIAARLEALDDKTLAEAQASYRAAITEETIRLMEEQVAAGAADSPFIVKAIAGLNAKYGPQPPQPWPAPEGQEGPSGPPQAEAGEAIGDVGEIDVDDESVPLEAREQALRQSLSAPSTPQSQWLPGGGAQIPDVQQHPVPPGQAGPTGQPLEGYTWQPPSRAMGRPPQPSDLDRAVDRYEVEAAEKGWTIDDMLAQEDPTWPAEMERIQREANATPPHPFKSQPWPENLPPAEPPQPTSGGWGPDPTDDQWKHLLGGYDAELEQLRRQQTDLQRQYNEAMGPPANLPDSLPPIDDSLLEPPPASASEQVGIGDLTKFLGQFADQGGQAFTDLLTGGAQSRAWADTPQGTPVQPTVGLEGGGMSAELPLVNVAPGIDLAEPAAASYHDLMNDPNMTPEMQQAMLRPGQGEVSAFRTYETQQNMRDRWDAGERPKGWVHRPGVPGPEAWRHTAGTALDLGTSLPPGLADLLMRHGWRQLADDPTHWWFAGEQ